MPEREYYDELVNDGYSESDSSSYHKIVKTDKHTHYYDVKEYDEKKEKYVYKKVRCFSSGDVGSVIRNAQYGTKYSYYLSQTSGSYVLENNNLFSSKKTIHHLVGSADEDLYFKVKMPGIVKKNGEKISVTVFYNTPEQYERHMNVTISRDVKLAWKEKKLQRMLNYPHKFLLKEELENKYLLNEHEGQCVTVK